MPSAAYRLIDVGGFDQSQASPKDVSDLVAAFYGVKPLVQLIDAAHESCSSHSLDEVIDLLHRKIDELCVELADWKGRLQDAHTQGIQSWLFDDKSQFGRFHVAA